MPLARTDGAGTPPVQLEFLEQRYLGSNSSGDVGVFVVSLGKG